MKIQSYPATPQQIVIRTLFFAVCLGCYPLVAQEDSSKELSVKETLERTTTMGPVVATVSLSPQTPTIGDLLELSVRVVASPEVEVLMPEFGEALGRFQISDFLPQESINSQGEAVYFQKYRLLSPASGDYVIPPILIEFVDRRPGEERAPEGMDAYELFTERIPFRVESVLVDDAAADLNPPLGKIEEERIPANSQSQNWGYFVVGLLMLVALGLIVTAIIGYQRRVIKKSAYEIARRQLDRLLAATVSSIEEIDQFYVELTDIIRKYLEHRYELRAPELTTEEFLISVAGSAELSNDHKKLLNDFLKHADLVKFAGLEPTQSDIEETIGKATRFLEETRENAPMLVDPESLSGRGASQRTGEQDA